MEFERRPAGRKIRDFEILPADAAFPPRADGLHSSLLSGKTTGVSLETIGFPLHISDLRGRVDAIDKSLPVALDRRTDAIHFCQVDTGPQDHFSSAPEVVSVRRPCFTPLVLISASAIFWTVAAFPRTTSTSRQLS